MKKEPPANAAALQDLPYSQMYLLCITDKAGNFNCNDARQIFGLVTSEIVELDEAGVISVGRDSAFVAKPLPSTLFWLEPVYRAIEAPFNENKLKSILSGFNAVFSQKIARTVMSLPYEELLTKGFVEKRKPFFDRYPRYVPKTSASESLLSLVKAEVEQPMNARLLTMAYILQISRQLKTVYGANEARLLDKSIRGRVEEIPNAKTRQAFKQSQATVKACFYSGSVFGFM